ncbi:hypothetical protein D9M71_715530 [compost metagenome]
MVRPFTILTHLTGWKYEQDFLCEISRLKLSCGCSLTMKINAVHQIESCLFGQLAKCLA